MVLSIDETIEVIARLVVVACCSVVLPDTESAPANVDVVVVPVTFKTGVCRAVYIVEVPLPTKLAELFIEKRVPGDDVPTPTSPCLSIMKYMPVDEPTSRAFSPAFVVTLKRASGVVVPIPIFPVELSAKRFDVPEIVVPLAE